MPQAKKPASPRIDIDVKPHATSQPGWERWTVIVTNSRGRCYFCSWAGDKPTDEQVMTAWIESRNDFGPYYGY